MSVVTRLIVYLLLPLLLGGGSYRVMETLVLPYGNSLPVKMMMVGIALLLALLPLVLYRFFIHSQLQEGFACIDDGRVLLPRELGLALVLNDRISHWQRFKQPLRTTVRLHDENGDLLVDIRVVLTITPDSAGKCLVQSMETEIARITSAIQNSLYEVSLVDKDMGRSLDGSTLLNEDDERVLKSKFLSTLESLAIEGIAFPHDTSGIEINRQVHKLPVAHKIPDTESAENDDALRLDPSLLESLGVG